MLKQLIACFVLFTVLAANFFRLVVWAQFKLNQDYIAANLCENRDKPLMHCNGKCYLMKKLKEAEEKAKKQSEKEDVRKAEITFFHQTILQPTLSPISPESIKIAIIDHTNPYGSRCLDAIFRPPKSIT